MTKDNFDKLKQHIEETLTLSKDNVINKTLELSSLHDNVLKLYIKELKTYKKLKTDKEKLYGELYHFYKREFDFNLDTKYEVEAYIHKDDRYYKEKLNCQNQEIIIQYLESVMDNIKNTSFLIKSYIELFKVQQGL